jgi:tRNA-Thr(GGU) m(6)t(6)A37 methyltransferase TsaA
MRSDTCVEQPGGGYTPAVESSIQLEPIGFVRHGTPDEVVKEQWAELVARIEILEHYAEGLVQIDGFSHLILLYWMHRLSEGARQRLVVRPRGMLRHGLSLEELPTIGVFACDSPARPNPIGLTIVELISREGSTLTVRGVDAYDGSPVLDVKPYSLDRLVPDAKDAPWHEELIRRTGARRV